MVKKKIQEEVNRQLGIFIWPVSIFKGNQHWRQIAEKIKEQVKANRDLLTVRFGGRFRTIPTIKEQITNQIKERHD